MKTVVCWLWKQRGSWPKYSEKDVFKLRDQLSQHLTIPYRFVCVSDREIDGVETIPLPKLNYTHQKWDASRYPQCFNRLWAFSPEGREVLGDFMSVDLDCRIVGNINHILSRDEEFLIAKGDFARNGYSGSLWCVNGKGPNLWDKLEKRVVNHACDKYAGSDQAVIRYLIPDAPLITPEDDGVYHYHYMVREKMDLSEPPPNLKIMFFAGRKKEEDVKLPWL